MARSTRKQSRTTASKGARREGTASTPGTPAPRLVNLENDTIELMVDHFTFKPEDRAQVVQGLSSAPHVQVLESQAQPTVLLFKTSSELSEDTLVGRVEVGVADLLLQTSSRRRADELRDLIRNACGELVAHRGTKGA